MSGDIRSESELEGLRQETIELQEEIETLRRQNQDLHEKSYLVQKQDRKWRKLLEGSCIEQQMCKSRVPPSIRSRKDSKICIRS